MKGKLGKFAELGPPEKAQNFARFPEGQGLR